MDEESLSEVEENDGTAPHNGAQLPMTHSEVISPRSGCGSGYSSSRRESTTTRTVTAGHVSRISASSEGFTVWTVGVGFINLTIRQRG